MAEEVREMGKREGKRGGGEERRREEREDL